MAHKNWIIYLTSLTITITSLIGNTSGTETANLRQETQTQETHSQTTCIYQENYELRESCRQIEAQILASTVRIEMSGWHWVGGQQLSLNKGAKSHATLIGNRYLVTHNHYGYSLIEEATETQEGYTSISLRKMDGEVILEKASLSVIQIAYEVDEILVLEIVDEGGNNLLSNHGLVSAKVIDWSSANLQAGMEVAHIDWNGEIAHIDWVEIEEVVTESQTTHIQVDNYALKGSSGGGAYWNGYHIGNVWAHNLEKDSETGQVTRLYTLIALNTLEVSDMR
jgi:hypothetical protein